jgi:DNA-binding MarR family transcriptional regulator
VVEQGKPEADQGDADESLPEAFWSLARRLRQASREAMSQWDITPSQSRALRVLARHGVMRPSELSEHLRIAPRSATEVVDSLEEKSLVRRSPDPHDRRATLLELTDGGRSLSQQIRSARGTETDRIFDKLSATDRTQLARILRKLRD